MKYFNERPETIKLPEENKGSMLFDILAMSFQICLLRQGKQAKIKKWEHIKLKRFCTQRKPSTKRIDNTQPTEWEKIFANAVSHKGLISKMYKEHIY